MSTNSGPDFFHRRDTIVPVFGSTRRESRPLLSESGEILTVPRLHSLSLLTTNRLPDIGGMYLARSASSPVESRWEGTRRPCSLTTRFPPLLSPGVRRTD